MVAEYLGMAGEYAMLTSVKSSLHGKRRYRFPICRRHPWSACGQAAWTPSKFPRIMDAFDEIGYADSVLYEVVYEEPNTISHPRDLRVKDFVRNHSEPEARSPVTVIGTRVP